MSVQNPSELESKKATILSIINSLVNGKFNAVVESESNFEVPTDILANFGDEEIAEKEDRNEDFKLCYLVIEGMTCDSCIFTITKALKSQPGVSTIHIDLPSKLASIVYDSRLSAPDFLIDHIHGLNEGFAASEAPEDAQIFHVQGLNCGNCVKKIESSVDNVTVNLPQAKAYCLKNAKNALKSIQNLGFKALPSGPYQGR